MAPLRCRLAIKPQLVPRALVIERLKKVGEQGAVRHNLEDRLLDTLEQHGRRARCRAEGFKAHGLQQLLTLPLLLLGSLCIPTETAPLIGKR